MSKPDKYHDCGHRLRCNDKRKRVQATPEPVVKESLTAQSKTPRTEASQDEAANFCGNVIVVPVEIAEQLETELAEAIKRREAAWESLDEALFARDQLALENQKLRAQVERLTYAMTDLMDCQNGPPLETWAKRWHESMDKCRKALESTKPSVGGEG